MTNCLISQPRLVPNATAADFSYFCKHLDNYLLVAKATDEQKLPVFLNCLPMDAMQIFDGLPEPKNTLAEAIARFTSYFTASTSILILRRQFYACRQSQGESITAYATRLRRLAADCAFTDAPEVTRDIFIMNVASDTLAERFLQEDPAKLTLELAIAKGQAFERAAQGSRAVRATVPGEACAVQSRPQRSTVPRRQHGAATMPAPTPAHATISGQNCYRCGSSRHKADCATCPAKDKDCRTEDVPVDYTA